MPKSSPPNEPPVPGPLRIRDSVCKALLTLRHFTAISRAAYAPQAATREPMLEAALVADVERELRCVLPDEVLACLANQDDELIEYGFALGDLVDHTALARERGCPKDQVAVGKHPDLHAFYCVSKNRPRERSVQIVDLDCFDGSTNWIDLAEWLKKHVDSRREFFAEDNPSLVTWEPSPADVAAFVPRLT